MTIRFTRDYQGYALGSEISTFSASQEAAIVAAGAASYTLSAQKGIVFPSASQASQRADSVAVLAIDPLTGVVSLVGPTGSLYPIQRTLYQGGAPIIYPMSGSIASNGALSGVTFDVIYPSCWLWLPIGAVYSLSPAGLYFCQMSSVSAGTVYLNTLTAGQAPNVPTTLTPVTAGAGAYTTLTSQVTIFTAAVPGAILGPNGQIDITHNWRVPNNANAKNILIQYGGQSALGGALASKLAYQSLDIIRFNGDTTNWAAFGQGGTTYNSSTFANNVKQTDNTVAQNITINVTMAVATDYMVFHGMRIVACPFM